MLKALIVDDEYLVRMGIRETIEWSAHNIEIVGEADNGEDGLSLALQHEPDVIVTDIRMPYMNGLELIAKVKEHRLNASIIVLSGYDEFQYAQAAIRYGASSYLLKPVDTDELAASVRQLGLEARDRLAKQAVLGSLTNELPAIGKQFWLDLLHGRLTDETEIEKKRELLGYARDANGLYASIVMTYTSSEEYAGAVPDKWLTEDTIESILKTHSLKYSAILQASPNSWCLVLPVEGEWRELLPTIRAFSYELVSQSKQLGCSQLSVGIGEPAERLSELSQSYEEAIISSIRASRSLGRVWYAKEEGDANTRKEVREALAYIRQHYASNITVEMVAAEVFVSPTHLMHLFRKNLDKTFYECLTDLRIEEAKRMLRDPKYRVYEVSERIGFGDAKYFSQIFKKMTGMTPSEYAKSYG